MPLTHWGTHILIRFLFSHTLDLTNLNCLFVPVTYSRSHYDIASKVWFNLPLPKDKELACGAPTPRILSLDDYFLQETSTYEKDPETGKKILVKVGNYLSFLDLVVKLLLTSSYSVLSYGTTTEERIFPLKSTTFCSMVHLVSWTCMGRSSFFIMLNITVVWWFDGAV